MSARRPTRSSGATQIPDVLPPSRTLTVRAADGTPLHTQVFGPPHGYPIVLTHGFVCAIRAWAYQIADLAGDYRVIAFDHRGHGRSGVPRRGAYSLNHLAADLDSVLDATLAPRERAVVAGHSMGGITIAAWSDRYRHKVRRRTDAVALINTTTGDLVRKVKLLSVPRELSPVRVLAGRSLVNTFGGFPLPGAASSSAATQAQRRPRWAVEEPGGSHRTPECQAVALIYSKKAYGTCFRSKAKRVSRHWTG